MTIQPRDIDALIELFEASDWDELRLSIQDFELFLSTDPRARSPGPSLGPASPAQAPASRSVGPSASSSGPTPVAPAAPPAATVPAHWVAVKAPNLGTFYRAPKPGAPAFVEIGQSVEPDMELCLIEVMKLFTTLKAGVKGVLKQVCVQDGVMVEFGHILFYIEPT